MHLGCLHALPLTAGARKPHTHTRVRKAHRRPHPSMDHRCSTIMSLVFALALTPGRTTHALKPAASNALLRHHACATRGLLGRPISSPAALQAAGPAGPAEFTSATDGDFDGFSSKVAFMFPGQGAQSVGMCASVVEEVPKAKELFTKASGILGYDLLDRCVHGPKEVLDSTEVSQPAIFVASMAAVEKLKQDQGEDAVNQATCAMGLSLGEYSALCFAGAISFEDGVRITKARGEAMQAAADVVDTSMVSVIGLDLPAVEELCAKASADSGKSVKVANLLCSGNYAVSGDTEACKVVQDIAKPEFKARMTVRLAVAGAFHTDFMQPAVAKLQEVLDTVEVKKPRIPVVSNVDAKPHSDPEVIKQILTTQVTSPVQWETTMSNMVGSDFEEGFELGPGKVIAGILKRISRRAKITNVEV